MVAGGACSTCALARVYCRPRVEALKVPIPARSTYRPQSRLERRRRVGGQNLHVWRCQLYIGREERRKCGHCITIAVRVDNSFPARGRGVNEAAASRFRGRTHQRATDGAMPTIKLASPETTPHEPVLSTEKTRSSHTHQTRDISLPRDRWEPGAIPRYVNTLELSGSMITQPNHAARSAHRRSHDGSN